ncbi:MAG: hypothetical protein AAFQ07_04060 [Chloroflexota bacterium]
MEQHHVIIYLNALLDAQRYRNNYANGVARIMSARYGGEHADWLTIQQNIFADWASYHADLNYSGEDGMADMREGQFRVTRALFRLANICEPSKAEITSLAQTLVSEAPLADTHFDIPAQYFLQTLTMSPAVNITVTAYFCEAQARAILNTSGHTDIAVIGADTFQHYEMDTHYFRCLHQHLKPNSLDNKRIYLDTRTDTLHHAQIAGFSTYQIAPDTLPTDWLSVLKTHIS